MQEPTDKTAVAPLTAAQKLKALLASRKAAQATAPGPGGGGRVRSEREAAARSASKSKPAMRK